KTVVLDQPGYLKSVALKARVHTQLFRNDNARLDALDSAITAYNHAVDFLHSLRRDYSGDESKQWLSEESSALFADAINTLYLKYRINGDSTLLSEIFRLMETGKYGILRESITHKKALQLAGIPDSLVKKEKELASRIRSCRTKILNLDEDPDTLQGSEVSLLYKNLVEYEEQYEKLKSGYAKAYPAYNRVTAEEQVASCRSICRILDDSSAILSYTLADTSLYIQILKTEGAQLVRIAIDQTFEKTLMACLKSIKTYDLDKFRVTSNTLYDILIKPVETAISRKKHLVIIPDKRLHYLPFETLCHDGMPVKNADFTKASFLIQQYAISYHYSASMFMNATKDDHTIVNIPESFIGFAPVFRTDSINGYILARNRVIFDTLTAGKEVLRSVSVNGNTWNELAFSENEIHDIVALFNQKAIPARGYLHSMANEQVFRNETGHYKYIHIATHGLINETHPDLSALILSRTITDNSLPYKESSVNLPENDGLLFSNELYDLDLQAHLVVLSACETGMGRLVNGEGVISMARGFLYAGIPNIIYTLWKVGDLSTHKLMVSFYNGLLQGMTYAGALQKAKLEMIRDEKYAYPLFWGGYTLIGPG
ncbi:MAG: CHAT domain-containing protein, partial [Bacteroidales bacterium]|nr:CHAT domain-containing protein [Bacteroidales bacterium]